MILLGYEESFQDSFCAAAGGSDCSGKISRRDYIPYMEPFNNIQQTIPH